MLRLAELKLGIWLPIKWVIKIGRYTKHCQVSISLLIKLAGMEPRLSYYSQLGTM